MTVICRRRRWTSKKKIVKLLSLLHRRMRMSIDLENKESHDRIMSELAKTQKEIADFDERTRDIEW